MTVGKWCSLFSFQLLSIYIWFQAIKILLGNDINIDLEPSDHSVSLLSSLSSNRVNWQKKTFHLIHSNPLANVIVGGKHVEVSKTRVNYVFDSADNIAASFYALPSGVIHLFAPKYGMEIMYDGSRVKLQVSYFSF